MTQAAAVDGGDEPVLNDAARALFDPFAFVMYSTVNKDGSPQVTMVAAFLDEREGKTEIVTFHRGWRQKLANINRVPQVALTIVPSAGALPRYPPQNFVLLGLARVEEGDAQVWSDRLADIIAELQPPGTTSPKAYMPDNGGYTTRITPTRVQGLGPWNPHGFAPASALLPPGATPPGPPPR